MTARVLLADDDLRVAEVVSAALEQEGLTVDHVVDGARAVERALGSDYALVVLDWMLPLMQGIDCVRSIRASSSVPILMLTARSHESDVVRALELGADDYVTKPFSVPEVAVRVRALLRRRELDLAEAGPKDVIRAGGLEIDRRSREARLGGTPLELTRTEFDLLTILADRAGETVSREEIMRHLWQTDSVGETRSSEFHVRNLRQKVGADRIVTVRGVGYRLLS